MASSVVGVLHEQEELALGLGVEEQRPGADVGLVGYLLGRDLIDAVPGEQLGGGGDDAVEPARSLTDSGLSLANGLLSLSKADAVLLIAPLRHKAVGTDLDVDPLPSRQPDADSSEGAD